MMVPEWPLLSGRKMETSWKCQCDILLNDSEVQEKTFLRQKGVLFSFSEISLNAIV